MIVLSKYISYQLWLIFYDHKIKGWSVYLSHIQLLLRERFQDVQNSLTGRQDQIGPIPFRMNTEQGHIGPDFFFKSSS